MTSGESGLTTPQVLRLLGAGAVESVAMVASSKQLDAAARREAVWTLSGIDAPATEELRDTSPDAQAQYERREAARQLDDLLAELSDERREVLVLVELEQLSVPEVAELLGQNVNTLYTRLRSARQDFERALGRRRARERRPP